MKAMSVWHENELLLALPPIHIELTCSGQSILLQEGKPEGSTQLDYPVIQARLKIKIFSHKITQFWHKVEG